MRGTPLKLKTKSRKMSYLVDSLSIHTHIYVACDLCLLWIHCIFKFFEDQYINHPYKVLFFKMVSNFFKTVSNFFKIFSNFFKIFPIFSSASTRFWPRVLLQAPQTCQMKPCLINIMNWPQRSDLGCKLTKVRKFITRTTIHSKIHIGCRDQQILR